MLYFSKAPIIPDRLDAEQFAKLQIFKDWAKSKGLIAEFDSTEDFRERLRRGVELSLRDNPYLSGLLSSPPIAAFREVSEKTDLIGADAAWLLKSAAQSDDGHIMMLRHLGGTQIQAGQEVIVHDHASHREVAKFEAAIDTLENNGLIKATSYKREMFRLTHAGYEAAASLNDLPGGSV